MATRALFIEVGADGDVIAALLPLTRNMIILSAFLRRAFGDLIGDFCHIAVVAGELNAVERHHHRSRRFIQLLNFCAIRKCDSVTSAFGGLRFEETAYFGARRG